MKKQFSIGLLALAAITITGCSDESSVLSDGRGRVSLSLTLDSSVTQAGGLGRAAGDLSADDLQLKMTSASGSYEKTWNNVHDFNDETSFAVGDYTLEAFYGDADTEDFDSPYYHGMTNVSVTDGGNTTVSMTAELANSMVTIEYTDAFRSYFTDYSAQLHSAGGAYIDYGADETRPLYVKPGECDVIISITKPNGTAATLQPTSFTAKAKTMHRIKFDVNNGNVGDAVLTISFDETVLDGETIEIELSDELMNAPAPVATPKGFTDGQTLNIIEGSAPDGELRANIVARGGLSAVTLTTRSRSLTNQGWPAEIDLMKASDAERQQLSALGLGQLGLWGTPDKMASINLTDVISHIEYLESGDNTTSFTLQVKDKYGKIMEQPLTLNVAVEPLRLTLSDAAKAYMNGTTFEVDLFYNGRDIKDVTLQIAKESGTYANVTFDVLSHTDNTYHLQVNVPAITHDLKLRARCGKVISDLDVTALEVPFDITYSDLNTFATHAEVNLLSKDETPSADIASRATLYVSTDGTNYTAARATLSGARFRLSGLKPGVKYLVKATCDGMNTASKELVTEDDAQLPNSDFEAPVTFDGSGRNWENVVFNGWGTNNALTTSQGSDYGYCRISGTIQADGESGKCALLRNVGWGSGNSATGSKGTSGTCKYVEVGLLHLGSNRTVRPAGFGGNDNLSNKASTGPLTTDDLDCGIPFSSRPSSMSFKYKYQPKNSADKGYAEITIYDTAGNVIDSKTRLLGASSSFADETITLDYPATAPKCGKIYVKFMSSYDMEYVKRNDSNYSGPGFANLSRGTFMGSQLYIDDIILNY